MDTRDYRYLPSIQHVSPDKRRIFIEVIDAHRADDTADGSGRVARYDILAYRSDGTPSIHRGVKLDWAVEVVHSHMRWEDRTATESYLTALYVASKYLTAAMLS